MKRLTNLDMKQIELEIMDEIDRVCRENGIKYVLGYGSCLGAVRHGGFIPWDDDLDVVMLREEYEKFVSAFEESKTVDRFSLVSYRDGTAPCAYSKVIDATTCVEEYYLDGGYRSGVWVDLFPFDEVPSSGGRFLAFRCRLYGNLRYLAATDASNGSNSLIRLAKRVICPFLKKMGPYGFAHKLDECASGASGSKSGKVADYIADANFKKVYREELLEPIEGEFEGHNFFIPRGYEEVLTIMYGDWKTPLPEVKRESHIRYAYRLQ